jgi:type IV pilus assembly protein PilO
MDKILDKIFKLPTNQKLALMLITVLAIGAAAFFGLFQPKMKELNSLQEKQADLNRQIQENKKVADNLGKYRKDYEQLKVDLDKALLELPNQKEIPSLLTSITSLGKEAGLDFLVFKPRGEQTKDFYSAVPVDIIVSGSFFNVANFFISVSKLSRIVNISNVVVSDIRDGGGRMLMKVNCLATTFRFLDQKEIKDDKKGK